MQVFEDDLAVVDQAKAYQIDDVLLVLVNGMKPSACHEVSLERSLLDVEPPAFIARVALDPRRRCVPDPLPAPFEVQAAFRIGGVRPEVIVHHSGGPLTVQVESVDPPADSGAPGASRAAAGGTSILEPAGPSEAVGYSRSYDLAEAIRDAIGQLPPQGLGIPDWLSSYTVMSIGVEIGGIGGFDHLKVHVSGG